MSEQSQTNFRFFSENKKPSIANVFKVTLMQVVSSDTFYRTIQQKLISFSRLLFSAQIRNHLIMKIVNILHYSCVFIKVTTSRNQPMAVGWPTSDGVPISLYGIGCSEQSDTEFPRKAKQYGVGTESGGGREKQKERKHS